MGAIAREPMAQLLYSGHERRSVGTQILPQVQGLCRKDREDHKYFYRRWESLDLPWLVRESEAYATDLRPAGERELRHFLGETSV
jgi:hypothetical protein